jgi:hypothetical protein
MLELGETTFEDDREFQNFISAFWSAFQPIALLSLFVVQFIFSLCNFRSTLPSRYIRCMVWKYLAF